MNNRNTSSIFWKRGAAYLVDLFCLYTSTVFTMAALLFAYAILHRHDSPKTLIELANTDTIKITTRVLQGIYYFSYFTIAHWYFGRTFGKYVFGLTLKTKDGKDLSFLRSTARTFAYILSGYPTLGVGYMLAYFRKDGKPLHDLLVGTVVEVKSEETEPMQIAA